MKSVPYWYGPRWGEYIGREEALPFDQHALKALVARLYRLRSHD